ncbi:MAG: HD-GYP domain-containing protein [Acidimicrobiales bacterium]
MGDVSAALSVAGVATSQDEGRWAEHRWLAGLLRVLALLLPVAGAVGASVLASRVVAQPDGWARRTLWWLGMFALSTAVLVAIDRQARKLLPLAVLLKLSLVFPDRVPSRWGVAMRASTTKQLRKAVAQSKAGRAPGEVPAEAAARVLALVAALNAHDRQTRGHAERVRGYAALIGKEMGLSACDRDKLNWAALLHDIGKLGISADILNKRGPLDPSERKQIEQHPAMGARLVEPLTEWLGPWARAVWEHHERWDGTGYPCGLSGEQISLGARVISVADSFDVMTALRSYKAPMSVAAAKRELATWAGRQFDPDVVRAMLSVSLGRLWPVMGPLTWLAQLPLLGGAPPVALPTALGTVGRTIVLVGAVQAVGPASLPGMYEVPAAVPVAAAAPARAAVPVTSAVRHVALRQAAPVSGSGEPAAAHSRAEHRRHSRAEHRRPPVVRRDVGQPQRRHGQHHQTVASALVASRLAHAAQPQATGSYAGHAVSEPSTSGLENGATASSVDVTKKPVGVTSTSTVDSTSPGRLASTSPPDPSRTPTGPTETAPAPAPPASPPVTSARALRRARPRHWSARLALPARRRHGWPTASAKTVPAVASLRTHGVSRFPSDAHHGFAQAGRRLRTAVSVPPSTAPARTVPASTVPPSAGPQSSAPSPTDAVTTTNPPVTTTQPVPTTTVAVATGPTPTTSPPVATAQLGPSSAIGPPSGGPQGGR